MPWNFIFDGVWIKSSPKLTRLGKQFRTIQQSSKYDVVDYQLKMEGRLNKLTRLGPEDFNCRKPQGMKHLSSINAESKWADRPMEMREDYLEIARMPGKPLFYTVRKNWQWNQNFKFSKCFDKFSNIFSSFCCDFKFWIFEHLKKNRQFWDIDPKEAQRGANHVTNKINKFQTKKIFFKQNLYQKNKN